MQVGAVCFSSNMYIKRRLLEWNYELSAKSRQIKFDLFWSLMKPWPGCSVLNLGAAAPHLGKALIGRENTLLEQPEQDPRWRSLRVVGCNLNPADMEAYRREYREMGFQALVADGCRLPFANERFDIVFSNAVIEHLTPEGQRLMANEILRVGRSWFVTTPNFWYPIEPHHKLPLFQYLPRSAQARIQRRLKTWPEDEPINLLTTTELQKLLPGGKVFKVRVTFYPETIVAFRPLQTDLKMANASVAEQPA